QPRQCESLSCVCTTGRGWPSDHADVIKILLAHLLASTKGPICHLHAPVRFLVWRQTTPHNKAMLTGRAQLSRSKSSDTLMHIEPQVSAVQTSSDLNFSWHPHEGPQAEKAAQ